MLDCYLKSITWIGEMAQYVACLPCKHEDLSWHLTPTWNLGVQIRTRNPSSEEIGTGGLFSLISACLNWWALVLVRLCLRKRVAIDRGRHWTVTTDSTCRHTYVSVYMCFCVRVFVRACLCTEHIKQTRAHYATNFLLIIKYCYTS